MGRRWGAFAMLCACLGAAAPAAPQASGGPRFEIRAYVFDGATLIPQARLREATAPFTGPGRDFGDVQHALEAVEKLYAGSGYSAVQVLLPEQELERGEVRLRIVEARLGRVIVEGNRYFGEANIRASVPSLAPGEAPNIVAVGRNLRVANENPSKQATVLLRSGEQEATVDAVVRVSDEPPLRQSLTVDNTGTPETGWLRVGYGVQYANGADLDHVLTFQIVGAPYKSDDPNSFSGTPSDRVLIVGAGLRIPLYGLGDALDFTAGYSNVDSGVIGGDLFTVSGAGGLFSTRYTHYLDRRDDYDQRLALAWDIRGYHFKDVRSVATGEQLQPDITVRPLSLTYAGLLRHPDGETSLSFGVSRNLPGGRDGSPEDFCQLPPNAPHGVSRTDGMGNCPDPWYVLWRGTFSHLRALPGNWQFRFEASGQGTQDMLVAGEQFGIGGANSVRGFQERAVADDRGWQGTLELYTPEFGRALELGAARLRALAFYDWGAVRRNMPAPGDVAAQGIASAGIGLRLNRGNSVNARFDLAWVLDPGGVPGIPPDEGTYRARGQHMAHFALSVVF
ncbi:MAG TPA: ShlB/FhaC/HecB family hemolysin secretion/activation protein [Burkholderiales bacterium]|nr:ShlB/FhaC/HecB family hemolysin secretion/activation protein [Burkholderiales bacterium]